MRASTAPLRPIWRLLAPLDGVDEALAEVAAALSSVEVAAAVVSRVDGTVISPVGEMMEVLVYAEPDEYGVSVGAAVVELEAAVGPEEAEADAEPDALPLADALPLPPLMPNWVEYWKVPSASLMSWMP
jgi:hypothetical protein